MVYCKKQRDKIQKVRFSIWNLFKHAEICEMPVIFHIGHTNGDYGLIDEYGLPRLEKTLQQFPKLKFLAHSQRFWSHISGDITEETYHGYPEGPVVPGGRIVELMRKYPNLCGAPGRSQFIFSEIKNMK